MLRRTFHTFLFSALTFSSSLGQEAETAPQEENPFEKFNWETSGRGKLSNHATIEIPAGYRFLNGRETAEVMTLFGNLPATYEGMIGTDNLDWFVVFEFEDSGYVKDDEKDDLDADELLETLRDQEKASNEERTKRGMETLNTVGWAMEPKYNEDTNNLEWGVILESGDGTQNVNYLTKILGRHGIMHTTLVCDPDALETILPNYQKLITGYEYNQGNTYAEFQDGDKVSNYGLKALVAGGAIFAAAKLGLIGTIVLWFKKAFKIIIIGVIAIGAWLKRLVTGRQKDA